MFRVGLTGGIASGKTTISRLFEELGITVIDTDTISHELMKPGQPAYQQSIEHFGQVIVNDDSTINRRLLREKVFNQPDEKKWLEEMIHPLIWEEAEKAISSAKSEYVILVVPLMFETGFQHMLDHVIAIDCPASVQKSRLMQRDNIDPDLAGKMIATQMSNKERISRADSVIHNTDDEDRSAEIQHLYRHLKRMADNKP